MQIKNIREHNGSVYIKKENTFFKHLPVTTFFFFLFFCLHLFVNPYPPFLIKKIWYNCMIELSTTGTVIRLVVALMSQTRNKEKSARAYNLHQLFCKLKKELPVITGRKKDWWMDKENGLESISCKLICVLSVIQIWMWRREPESITLVAGILKEMWHKLKSPFPLWNQSLSTVDNCINLLGNTKFESPSCVRDCMKVDSIHFPKSVCDKLK